MLFIVLTVGFAFLPFIWAVNSIWFFDEAFRKPAYDEQKSIRRCKLKVQFENYAKDKYETLRLSVIPPPPTLSKSRRHNKTNRKRKQNGV